MLLRSTIAFLLASGVLPAAFAQSASSDCANSTILINSLDTLTVAQSCRTVSGDIVIEYGEDLPAEIEFPLLEEVGGSFISLDFDEAILAWRISAPNLVTVVSDFYISSWVNLSVIDMPVFDQANRIRLNDLPQLTSANLLSTVRALENNYEVWNTSLTNITNSRLTYATFVEIFDNPSLETLELTALRNASYNIALRRNRPGMSVRLPSLVEVWYFDLQQIGSLAVPVLETAIGYFIVNASNVDALSAPSLVSVGIWYDPHILVSDNRGLIITNNPQLETFGFPKLQTVWLDLIFRNNTSLRDLDLAALSSVAANVALEGPFTNVSFPELDHVGGNFTIGVDQSSTICGEYQALKDSGGIRGDFSCPVFEEPPATSQFDLDPDALQDYIEEYLQWAGDGGSGDGTGQPNAGASLSVARLEAMLAMFIGLVPFILAL